MRRLAGLGCALALGACSTETVTEQRIENRTALDHGRDLFHEPTASPSSLNTFSCSTCHLAEDDGKGRILPGAPLAGVVERPSFWGGAELDLLRSINHCRFFFMTAQAPWTVEDEEAKVMYLYLSTLSPVATEAQPLTLPTTAEDLPAGDAVAGANVYAASCQSCHGAVHSGTGRLTQSAPVLPDESVAYFESLGFDATLVRVTFVEKVRHGGFLGLFGTMPPYGKEALSDAQLSDLLAFLALYP